MTSRYKSCSCPLPIYVHCHLLWEWKNLPCCYKFKSSLGFIMHFGHPLMFDDDQSLEQGKTYSHSLDFTKNGATQAPSTAKIDFVFTKTKKISMKRSRRSMVYDMVLCFYDENKGFTQISTRKHVKKLCKHINKEICSWIELFLGTPPTVRQFDNRVLEEDDALVTWGIQEKYWLSTKIFWYRRNSLSQLYNQTHCYQWSGMHSRFHKKSLWNWWGWRM